MSWECGNCWEDERVVALDAVCHHCGKVLCPAHRYRVLDREISGIVPGSRRRAVHCVECVRWYHPRSVGAWRARWWR